MTTQTTSLRLQHQAIHVAKITFFIAALLASFIFKAEAQCGGGTTQATLNWDWHFVNSAGYTLGTTGTRFCFGVNNLQITSTGTVSSNGEDGNHTGNGGVSINSASDPSNDNDADFTVGNGTITLTFDQDVQNLSFTLYDIDNTQSVTVTAANAASAAQNITLTGLGASTLSLSGSGTTSATAAGGAGDVLNSSNDGAVTVSIAGPVKVITLTFTTAASSDNVWLSDIQACVTGNFASNYQAVSAPQSGEHQYFLVAIDSVCNVVDAVTGAATELFDDPNFYGINSLAYDPYHQIVYYCEEDPTNSANHAIYKYDVKSGTRSTLISDVTASPWNLVLSDEGVGSGGATFYDGSLYLGVETTTDGDAASAYRINFSNDGVTPVSASQLEAQQGADAGGATFGYGDFVANDDTFYISNAGNINFEIFELNNQRLKNFYPVYKEQLSVGVDGKPRFVEMQGGSSYDFGDYNGGGNFGSSTTMTGLVGNVNNMYVNDAAEVFKYPADYGDAPLSYDTAYHMYVVPASSIALRIGAGISYEVDEKVSAAANLDTNDDGVSSFPPISTATTSYSLTVSVFNNTGSNATLAGWIDFNLNGTYDSGERTSVTVSTSGSQQNVTLTWSGITIPNGGTSFARLRLASNASEVTNPTGKATDGEVEDYQLVIGAGITGKVWDDGDGSIAVNGGESNTNAGNTLYAYLVSGGTVVDSAQVKGDGTYTFNRGAISTAYDVVLSTASVTIGNGAPSASLPSGWVNTGTNFNGTTTPNTGSGSITTGTTTLVNTDYAIEQLPTPAGGSQGPLTNPQGVNFFTVDPAIFTATDNDGSPTTLRITAFPANISSITINGTNYTSGSWPGGGVTVPVNGSGNPTQTIDIDPVDGYTTIVTIPFVSVDNATRESTSSAVATIYFGSVLPVELTRFSGQTIDNRYNHLDWITSAEMNNNHFELERSADGMSFEKIGEVAGHGTSQEAHSYAFDDVNPMNGVNYYRLKQVDNDGTYSYSNVVPLTITSTQTLDVSLNPNVTRDNFNVEINTEEAHYGYLTITDIQGRVINQINISINQGKTILPLNQLSNQAAGLYLIRINVDGFKPSDLKVVKIN